MPPTIKLDTQRLNRIRAGLQARAAEVIAADAFEVESAAKPLAPVDTGALRNSIKAIKRGELLWWVIVGVEYGKFVEFGTSRHAAQPFLIPAVERVQRSKSSRERWEPLFE